MAMVCRLVGQASSVEEVAVPWGLYDGHLGPDKAAMV